VTRSAALGFVYGPTKIGSLVVLFILEGIVMAAQETLELAIATDLLPEAASGTGFGVLAETTGVGNLICSVVLGFMWGKVSPKVAFSYGALMSAVSTVLLFRPS
jgi:MFS family permease